MSDMADNPDWSPLTPEEHDAQLAAIFALLDRIGPAPMRVLDLGAGSGRIAAPLVGLGHRVAAIDSDPEAVRACAAAGVEARCDDMLAERCAFDVGAMPAQAVLCVGHTFMLVHGVADAASLWRCLREQAEPGTVLILDNFCDPLWDEVASGRWLTGVSEDGAMQLVWAVGDNVFALREGEAVDAECSHLLPSDRLHRLWTRGQLAMLAAQTGWSGPDNDASGELLLFQPA
jgi:SAM-dependent methyltransferase